MENEIKVLNTWVDSSNNPFVNQKQFIERQNLVYLIEDKDTCLRIWIGFHGTVKENRENPPNTVYMRLDKYKQYSAPLDEHSYKYLEDKKGIIKQLLPFGFTSSIDNLQTILNIVKPLKQTQLKVW